MFAATDLEVMVRRLLGISESGPTGLDPATAVLVVRR
jgi:hypothetical protein